MRRVFQRCSNSRFIGHTLSPAKMSCQVVGLHPYTSHWFLLLPHYKDVPSMPSSLQSLDDGVRCGCSKVTGYWCVPSTAGKTRIKPPPHPSPSACCGLRPTLTCAYLVSSGTTLPSLTHRDELIKEWAKPSTL
ncbi:uncharacterized protein LOC126993473 isoform X3 [Eriocheir sinensis]|uniref:uncharacterized protein LOC126993473 isoform X3 n=1 Tax=Eriocheir sinensis TaxID=95602 RepID=UPI0021C63FA3|nr:uncharacterized protein LOC126993473 isoform X3 [Eriocheir sinensis]